MRVKASCARVKMFKGMRLVILFDMFLDSSFKMTAGFASTARTSANWSKTVH